MTSSFSTNPTYPTEKLILHQTYFRQMLGIMLALLTAFFDSLKDLFSKKGLKKIDEYIIAWSLPAFSLILLVVITLFVGIPPIGPRFWLAVVISGSINIATLILYMKALKSSDLSLATPMSLMAPLFLLVTSPLIVGEFPGLFGVIGILLIVGGAYTLKIKEIKKGYLAPFKALLREKGPRLMLIVAFLWSISSNFDKIGIQESSTLFWVFAWTAFIVIGMFPIMLYKSGKNLRQIPQNFRSLVPIGVFSGIMILCQVTALKLTLVAYVISLKKTSALLSVLWGFLIFKEKGIKERLLGVAMMVAGVVMIAVFS